MYIYSKRGGVGNGFCRKRVVVEVHKKKVKSCIFFFLMAAVGVEGFRTLNVVAIRRPSRLSYYAKQILNLDVVVIYTKSECLFQKL